MFRIPLSIVSISLGPGVLASAALTACSPAVDERANDAYGVEENHDATCATPPSADGDGPGDATSRGVFVHLFEWKWADIAEECERFLGPKGFAGVQVSPPNEHAVLSGHPWYQRYQPVGYMLESRGGTRAEFIDMVRRCEAAGVDIYVDAVINHMTAQDSGTGSGGTRYAHYEYPGLYQWSDFHHCGRNSYDDIQSYGDRTEVQTCELVNLADLDTGSDKVRATLAGYLNDLLAIGVAGFRLDASKHMASGDIAAVLGEAQRAPYVFQEVIDQGGEPIRAAEYFQNGHVTEFRYGLQLGQVFKRGRLASLERFGPEAGLMPSENAVVFTDNHDNQRGHGGAGDVVTHKDGRLYELANVFMLAWPYGRPAIMSSYAFTDPSQGPPSDANGNTKNVYQDGQPRCFDAWVCEHRWRPIANMVQFSNVTSSSPTVSNWWSNGDRQIAFSRGDKGFVVINREDGSLSNSFQAGLPAGDYCDVISGEPSPDGMRCTGKTITVDAEGRINVVVEPMSAIAIHAGARSSLPSPQTRRPDP